MALNGSTMAPIGSGEGNTKLPRISASLNWCFTFFYKQESEIGSLVKVLEKISNYFFGLEICPDTGRNHIQGYVEFYKKSRPIESVGIKEIHWEKRAKNATRMDSIIYCSKEGKIYTNTKWAPPEKIIDPLKDKTLHKFQTEILDLIKTQPDDRKIYWYWCKEGNTGKTTLAKHICINYNAIFVNGKAADVKCGIATMMKDTKVAPKVVLFGFPRTAEDYVSYAALEEVKDGMFFSGKFESGMCVFNPPHVIVFANFEPDVNKLSKDRWIIENIREQLSRESRAFRSSDASLELQIEDYD